MFKKIIEGKNSSYVVDLNKQIDDYPLFMDVTRLIEDAIRRDVQKGYRAEQGPFYAIERYRAEDYVAYVSDKLTRENYLKFDTQNYRFFLGSVPVKRNLQVGA